MKVTVYLSHNFDGDVSYGFKYSREIMRCNFLLIWKACMTLTPLFHRSSDNRNARVNSASYYNQMHQRIILTTLNI